MSSNFTELCEHGRPLWLQITLPKDPTPFDYMNVAYGLIPYIVVALSWLELLLTGPLECKRRPGRCLVFRCGPVGTREASFVSFLFVIDLVVIALKNITKEARPNYPCHRSGLYEYGFPSGHATMAVGCYTFMFLDGVFRVIPKVPVTLEEAEHEAETHDGIAPRQHWCSSIRRMLTVVPVSAKDVLSHSEFVYFCAVWAILLLPVPPSRIALNDHNAAQVSAGCFLGAFIAVGWFIIIRHGQRRWNGYLGERVFWLFKHNYALPRFEVKSNCVRLLAQCRYTSVHRMREELLEMQKEIAWYLMFTHRQQNKLQHEASVRPSLRSNFESEMNFLSLESNDLRCLARLIGDKIDGMLPEVPSASDIESHLSCRESLETIADGSDVERSPRHIEWHTPVSRSESCA